MYRVGNKVRKSEHIPETTGEAWLRDNTSLPADERQGLLKEHLAELRCRLTSEDPC
jgi:hypothetical protein